MNKEQFSGKWDQLKGKIKETYGKLTDDQIALYNGKQDQFFGAVKETYGEAKESVQEKMQKMERDCGCSSADSSSNSTRAA